MSDRIYAVCHYDAIESRIDYVQARTPEEALAIYNEIATHRREYPYEWRQAKIDSVSEVVCLNEKPAPVDPHEQCRGCHWRSIRKCAPPADGSLCVNLQSLVHFEGNTQRKGHHAERKRPATPWAVICREHGQVFLTEEEYVWQMNHPDDLWGCPICGKAAQWDDDNFEKASEGD